MRWLVEFCFAREESQLADTGRGKLEGAPRSYELVLRWYLVAFAVGAVMAVLPLGVGFVFMAVGNALGACSGEMGCVLPFVAGACIAPLGFLFSAAAAGFTANRLLLAGAAVRREIWRASFGAGFLAVFPAALLTLAALALR